MLEAIDIPLNPMSATLGALVIAVATEFSVILSARYHEQREAGESIGEALRLTYARTGTAVLASGVTSIAGFGVLAFSGITMLRDFGLVTVVDLSVALAGVMLVLPAALVWAEEDFRPLPAVRSARCGRRAEARDAPTPAPEMADSGGDGGGWWPEGDRPGPSRPRRSPRSRREPPRGLASPKSSPLASRYSLFVGLAFVALIIVALLNLVGGTDETGITLDEGTPLAEFAAPNAAGTSDADANIAQDDCESSLNPCPSDQQRTPACEIDRRGGRRDPGLRPLRQAAGDLVLVHPGR